MRTIEPNNSHDWVEQRKGDFSNFVPLTSQSTSVKSLFFESSLGMCSGRDAWIYNYSRSSLGENISLSIEFFNEEIERYLAEGHSSNPKDFVRVAPDRIAWSREVLNRFKKSIKINFSNKLFFLAEYRPFTKMWCYRDSTLITNLYRIPKIFLNSDTRVRTLLINSAAGSPDLSCWMTDRLPDREITRASKCFPMSRPQATTGEILNSTSTPPGKSVTNLGFELDSLYSEHQIDSDTLFYYVYGILYSLDYLSCYRQNLLREHPQIPFVESLDDFFAFADAGRALADLHVGYDQVSEFPVTENWIHDSILNSVNARTKFRVEKMKFVTKSDKSTIQYNPYLTVSGIPDKAYDFKVNGKSCVEWVMDRQRVT